MQKRINPIMIIPIFVVVIIMAVVACTSTQVGKGAEMEKLLTASGFKMAVADTPERLAQLKQFPQRKIVPHNEGDKLFYIYANVEKCNCAYAGDEEAYRRYQKLVADKKLAEEDRRDAARNQQSQTDSDDNGFGRNW
jgi:hypothetical protein